MLNNWNITCFGDSDGFIEISSTGGIHSHDYAWSAENMPLSDSTLQDQSNLVAGRYDLTITDSIGCSIDTFFVLIEPNPLRSKRQHPPPPLLMTSPVQEILPVRFTLHLMEGLILHRTVTSGQPPTGSSAVIRFYESDWD